MTVTGLAVTIILSDALSVVSDVSHTCCHPLSKHDVVVSTAFIHDKGFIKVMEIILNEMFEQ